MSNQFTRANMAETQPQPDPGSTTPDPTLEEQGKGKAFFDRADQVAETGEADYAIEMYVEGIKREPSNVERGHQPLREVALRRKLAGGKGLGLRETLKYGSSKDLKENLANAAFILAKDPGSRKAMLTFLKAAQALERPNVIEWITDILFEEQRQAPKGKKVRPVLMTIIDSYAQLEQYQKALQVIQLGMSENPADNELMERSKELSAKMTMQKYAGDGDITTKVVNKDDLERAIQSGHLVQTQSFLEKQREQAEKDYIADPTVPGKIHGYVEALLRMNDASYESTAIDVLNKAVKETGSYNWKMRIGDIKIKQMTRRYRELLERGDRAAAMDQARKQLAFELEEYAERVVNYPTDLGLKFELGKRQYIAGPLDEAIGSLQQARRDPRRRVAATLMMGQAFAKKQWYSEAADSYQGLLEGDLSEDQEKEVRYYLGDAHEKMDRDKEAEEQYSRVAQIDYNYKDVRQRLENLRKKRQGQG